MNLSNTFLSLVSKKPYLIRKVANSWIVSLGPTAGILPDFTSEKLVYEYNIYNKDGDCIGVAMIKEGAVNGE